MASGALTPHICGEFWTVRCLQDGNSIARFGDGELKIAYGAGYSREPANPELTAELRDILNDPAPSCLIGVPTFDPKGPKAQNWERHRARFEAVMDKDRTYYSAFISRPDSAPWIQTEWYANKVADLWRGKRVTVVCERKGSMLKTVRLHAAKVLHIECPRMEAYSVIDQLEVACINSDPDIIVMSAGPTATCLANRFAAHGIQAIDLGSAGGFLHKLLRP